MVKRIERIRCISSNSGIVQLQESWDQNDRPPLFLGEEKTPFASIEPLPGGDLLALYGYEISGDLVRFVVSTRQLPRSLTPFAKLYLAASINGWEKAIGQSRWEMKRIHDETHDRFILELPLNELLSHGSFSFKFVTSDRQWLEVSEASPNREVIEMGRYNLRFEPKSRDNLLFCFKTAPGRIIGQRDFLCWDDGGHQEVWPLFYLGELFQLDTDAPMGPVIENERTTFRVFAPRADQVMLELSHSVSETDFNSHSMNSEVDGSWSIGFPSNLSGHFYHYRVLGANDAPGAAFDPDAPILDPYAKATLGRAGPGIVISPDRFPEPTPSFTPPPIRDLVIVEAHLRDLLAKSPLQMSEVERLGFSGLRQWALDKGNYLQSLGVNAVELQPLQEFDNISRDEYHWGYMPVNYFAPASAYSSNPAIGSGIEEFRSVVEAFHQNGVSVIVDVVYNHVGLPNHLSLLDKAYYFDLDESLESRNWSGCGNDLRRDAPMVRRLLVDSLLHWITAFDVDGFRFDLAELLELSLLKEIEDRLRAVKPSVLLIAEPWSFRGRVDDQLRETAFSSWNDGFRDFIRNYVQGKGDSDGVLHYLKGCPDKVYGKPEQSVNYVESHDDLCFIDAITENPGGNGRNPTFSDIRRARLALAITFMAQGVPMLAAGQDFLRSKSGVSNTYLRGDLNALDYERSAHSGELREYCRNWISFRLSEAGCLLRLNHYPKDSFWEEYHAVDGSAGAILLNADESLGSRKLLFAVNPDPKESTLSIARQTRGEARLLATADVFDERGLADVFARTGEDGMVLPSLQLAMWELQ